MKTFMIALLIVSLVGQIMLFVSLPRMDPNDYYNKIQTILEIHYGEFEEQNK